VKEAADEDRKLVDGSMVAANEEKCEMQCQTGKATSKIVVLQVIYFYISLPHHHFLPM